ncbi:AHH domain-containing protein [Myxococcus sp. CA051A]|uniref:AHH domain-containing protein n=1 Tax=Myxococcus sp. CA051A TaxID=2741739 RepID=UPI00157B7BE7|nr:AHH domain-containing protein [Myxococcus sp. CA051A]NTX59543.1 AHH domain-containing protein [Myxococcus sp. CA051A]
MPVVIRGRRVRFEQAGPNDGPKPPKRPPCSYCGKPEHEFAATPGWSVGNSAVLLNNILRGAESTVHPWYTGRWSIAAHHLICSEAMADDDDWHRICWQFGYDINGCPNGVVLPSQLPIACELHVPVHRGPHAAGWAFDLDLSYPDAVKAKLDQVGERAVNGDFCPAPSALVTELDALSSSILTKVAKGAWTISADGLDYLPGGNGCAGAGSIPGKPDRACPRGRKHGAQHGDTRKPLARRPLKVGT